MKQTVLAFLAILLGTAHATAQTPFFRAKRSGSRSVISPAIPMICGLVPMHETSENISQEIQKSSSRTCPARGR